jgi:hypothetical protein
MKERCPSGSSLAFPRRRGGRPDRIVGSPGGRGPSPESAESSTGGLTRGANGAFCLSGPHVLPEPVTLLSPPSPPWLSPKPLRRPSPTLLSLKRFSLPQALTRRGRPASARGRPLSGFCPEPALCAQSPPPSSPSSALRACVLAGRKRAFACGVPGALRGTWVSSTRFDEMNDPCPRNVLI